MARYRSAWCNPARARLPHTEFRQRQHSPARSFTLAFAQPPSIKAAPPWAWHAWRAIWAGSHPCGVTRCHHRHRLLPALELHAQELADNAIHHQDTVPPLSIRLLATAVQQAGRCSGGFSGGKLTGRVRRPGIKIKLTRLVWWPSLTPGFGPLGPGSAFGLEHLGGGPGSAGAGPRC